MTTSAALATRHLTQLWLLSGNVWYSTGYDANPANSMYYASPSMSGFSGAISYSLG
jgi:hypothetical protein